jgi:hypothetical protein
MGPNYDPAAGPVGQLAPNQVRQVKAIRAVLRQGAGAAVPKRLKRADSFFGIHFDFHAGPDNPEIGRNTTPEMIESILDAAHPDYIQVESRPRTSLSAAAISMGVPPACGRS